MGVSGDKIGEGVVRYWPLTNSFFLLWVLTSVRIFGENRSRNATVRVLADWQTHRQTDANRFYNLSHAIAMGQITRIKYAISPYGNRSNFIAKIIHLMALMQFSVVRRLSRIKLHLQHTVDSTLRNAQRIIIVQLDFAWHVTLICMKLTVFFLNFELFVLNNFIKKQLCITKLTTALEQCRPPPDYFKNLMETFLSKDVR